MSPPVPIVTLTNFFPALLRLYANVHFRSSVASLSCLPGNQWVTACLGYLSKTTRQLYDRQHHYELKTNLETAMSKVPTHIVFRGLDYSAAL